MEKEQRERAREIAERERGKNERRGEKKEKDST
jgi:hypothetical protein